MDRSPLHEPRSSLFFIFYISILEGYYLKLQEYVFFLKKLQYVETSRTVLNSGILSLFNSLYIVMSSSRTVLVTSSFSKVKKFKMHLHMPLKAHWLQIANLIEAELHFGSNVGQCCLYYYW